MLALVGMPKEVSTLFGGIVGLFMVNVVEWLWSLTMFSANARTHNVTFDDVTSPMNAHDAQLHNDDPWYGAAGGCLIALVGFAVNFKSGNN